MTRATWVLLAALAVSCAPHDPSHAERDETPTPSAVEDAGVVTPDAPEHAPPEPADPVARCEASQVGLPILRRLTRDELESTLRAAFPEVAATWPVSPVLLGRGEALFAGIDTAALGYRCIEHVRSERATHFVLGK